MLNSVSYLLVLKNDTFENFSYVCLEEGEGVQKIARKKSIISDKICRFLSLCTLHTAFTLWLFSYCLNFVELFIGISKIKFFNISSGEGVKRLTQTSTPITAKICSAWQRFFVIMHAFLIISWLYLNILQIFYFQTWKTIRVCKKVILFLYQWTNQLMRNYSYSLSFGLWLEVWLPSSSPMTNC